MPVVRRSNSAGDWLSGGMKENTTVAHNPESELITCMCHATSRLKRFYKIGIEKVVQELLSRSRFWYRYQTFVLTAHTSMHALV